MPDSRLTDLPSITLIDNDDVLYVADTSLNASNKITYSDLINNKFTTARNDIDALIVKSNEFDPIRTEVLNITSTNFQFKIPFDTTTVTTATNFVTSFELNNNITSAFPVSIEYGDFVDATFTNTGGLSGLQTLAYAFSTNALELYIINNSTSTKTLTSDGSTKNLVFRVEKKISGE